MDNFLARFFKALVLIICVSLFSLSSSMKVSFQVDNIPNEFIIQYKNKYYTKARTKYIHTKLHKSNISNWAILPRQNLASSYPSDFDVLRIESYSSLERILDVVNAHPAVKAVVPHRSVQRILRWTNNTLPQRQLRGVARKKAQSSKRSEQVTTVLHTEVLWKLGITGKGVKVAIFDTGLTQNHPHFRNVKERTNWTNEKSVEDGVSHGTFVAGVIASAKECLGFAPDSELHIYKVFTNSQVSYTSWFLDAFNYVIYRKVNILNLSIGGPDFMDFPFVDKVLELSANKIIMVSAIGNDGPLYGTLNNPGDQSDVIGVGGINFDDKLAKFSSRGMSTWELPFGYGRVKPDIVTYGSQVQGSDVRSGCRRLSGTSVSSPVVAGAVALLTSGALHKIEMINPAALKQVLIEGAVKLPNYNMFEQGHGKLSLLKSMQLLLKHKPKITLIPSSLDFTSNYMWPYSSQPLFYGSMDVIVNVTILNSISVASRIVGTPKWEQLADSHGHFLNISTSFPSMLWPWSGWMAVYIAANKESRNFEGIAKGNIILSIESIGSGKNESHISEIHFPIVVKITPKPPRHKRILWDQYHSLRYPPGYIPRDDLKVKSDPLDWRADHIHTNFRDMYIHLRNAGYYVDVLRQPYSCFNASEYGTLLIVDPEEEFFDDEIVSLESYIYDTGLSIIVFADWYNTTVMKKIKFFDENTRQWWIPDTGGSNIPALNDLLNPFGISFGDFVGEGHFKLGDHSMYYASGASISRFPKNPEDILIGTNLNDQGLSIIENVKSPDKDAKKIFVPIMGLFQTELITRQKNFKEQFASKHPIVEDNDIRQNNWLDDLPSEKNPILNNRVLLHNQQQMPKSIKHEDQHFKTQNTNQEGRIAVYGDSNCLDSTHMEKACYWLLITILDFTMNSHKSKLLQNLNQFAELSKLESKPLPMRLASSKLTRFSKVLNGRENMKNRCKDLQRKRATSYNSSEQIRIVNETAEYENNDIPNNLELMGLLNTEIARIALNEEQINLRSIDFNIMTSVIFMITLSLIVIILFILFFKRKIVYKV
ncbi:membrane-bound transcription factor site-1 protease [Scaptodrosophila lebanonensis]|uniref:Membrane-bound transcription factor site-1 protease n=1 Tax=Drosophila lebanonensis TaxID=7225 RepID=A0A6J2TBW4_DROLE|nr:membrane-bound transcription factor site-1 protease [Scaptodrosophila lebanonensis]